MFLTSGWVLTTFLTTYIVDGNRQKSHKIVTFLVQAGTFLCFQAGRSSAMRSSASDLTVMTQLHIKAGRQVPLFRRKWPSKRSQFA